MNLGKIFQSIKTKVVLHSHVLHTSMKISFSLALFDSSLQNVAPTYEHFPDVFSAIGALVLVYRG